MPVPDPVIASFDLALVGFGRVGRRFATLLSERRDQLAQDYHLAYRVVGIATGRHGTAMHRDGLDLTRAVEIIEAGGNLGLMHDDGAGSAPTDTYSFIERLTDISDHGPRVVVETTTLDVTTGEPAVGHVRAAIAAGAHVVTANKGPAAFAYHALRGAADAADVRFLTEGAVLDGIPVLNLVRETLPTVMIKGFRGVINSTTHYMLTAMEQGGSAADALAAMQVQGVAEADASLDVKGWDAAAKTAVLVNVLMDGRTTLHAIARTGISGLTGEIVRNAVRRGRRIKLVASASRSGDTISGAVAPVELDADDPLAKLDGQANALVLVTDLLGEIVITQRHGGLTQTAFALLADLITIRSAVPETALHQNPSRPCHQ